MRGAQRASSKRGRQQQCDSWSAAWAEGGGEAPAAVLLVRNRAASVSMAASPAAAALGAAALPAAAAATAAAAALDAAAAPAAACCPAAAAAHIFDSLLGAPPVTLATRRAASSVFSSLSCSRRRAGAVTAATAAVSAPARRPAQPARLAPPAPPHLADQLLLVLVPQLVRLDLGCSHEAAANTALSEQQALSLPGACSEPDDTQRLQPRRPAGLSVLPSHREPAGRRTHGARLAMSTVSESRG